MLAFELCWDTFECFRICQPIRPFLNISEPSACNDDTLVPSSPFVWIIIQQVQLAEWNISPLECSCGLAWFSAVEELFSVYRDIWRRSQSLPLGSSSLSFFMRLAEIIRRAGTNQPRNWGCQGARAKTLTRALFCWQRIIVCLCVYAFVDQCTPPP